MILQRIARFFSRSHDVPSALQERLQSTQRNHPPRCKSNIHQDRLVVLDVESSGLNPSTDRLLAIGAAGIRQGKLILGDHFDILLKQEFASDKSNILIHGISGTAQRTGLPAEEALLAFLEYLDGAPLIAFHVAFDETMLRKAFHQFLHHPFRHCWVDLAYVLPELLPGNASCHALDDWLARYGIAVSTRHNALADATATAQLALMALHSARRKKLENFASLQDIEKAHRWLTRT